MYWRIQWISFQKVCVTGELFSSIMLYVILQKGVFTGILTKMVYINIKRPIIGYSRLLSDGTSADLHVIFCYCSYTWGHQGPFLCFMDEEVDGVGEKRWEDTTMFEVQTLLKAFWNMSLGSVCFNDGAFFFW